MVDRGRVEQQPEQDEEGDWMLEVSFDHEWLAGGSADDVEVARLSATDRAHFIEAAHDKADEILKEGGLEAASERHEWTKKFMTEHMVAVDNLQRHPSWGYLVPKRCSRHAEAGEISGLYTYGGPGTALAPLTNTQRQDGKFPGMRMLTQRLEKVAGITRAYHDPFGWLAGLVGHKHPHMDLLLLPVNGTPSEVSASRATSRHPRSDMAFWVAGHRQDIYTAAIELHKGSLDPKIHQMLYIARAVDPSITNGSAGVAASEARKVGWNLIAQSTSTKLHRFDKITLDVTSLFQDPATQACAIAFVPTHHLTQWLANFRFTPVSFCGIPNVHKGFRNQVRRAIRSPEWASRMQPALAACPKLYVTGHSLGAGQAQLMAACLQRAPAQGQAGWDDYKFLAWTPRPGQARILPAIA